MKRFGTMGVSHRIVCQNLIFNPLPSYRKYLGIAACRVNLKERFPVLLGEDLAKAAEASRQASLLN
jgi:hypothetical protein